MCEKKYYSDRKIKYAYYVETAPVRFDQSVNQQLN